MEDWRVGAADTLVPPKKPPETGSARIVFMISHSKAADTTHRRCASRPPTHLSHLPLDHDTECEEPRTATVSSGWLVSGVVSQMGQLRSCQSAGLVESSRASALSPTTPEVSTDFWILRMIGTCLCATCTCFISTVFWIYGLVGTCLCVITERSLFCH